MMTLFPPTLMDSPLVLDGISAGVETGTQPSVPALNVLHENKILFGTGELVHQLVSGSLRCSGT